MYAMNELYKLQEIHQIYEIWILLGLGVSPKELTSTKPVTLKL